MLDVAPTEDVKDPGCGAERGADSVTTSTSSKHAIFSDAIDRKQSQSILDRCLNAHNIEVVWTEAPGIYHRGGARTMPVTTKILSEGDTRFLGGLRWLGGVVG